MVPASVRSDQSRLKRQSTVALAASRLVAAVKAVPPGTSPQQTLEQVEPVLKSTKTQFQASYNGLACSSTG